MEFKRAISKALRRERERKKNPKISEAQKTKHNKKQNGKASIIQVPTDVDIKEICQPFIEANA